MNETDALNGSVPLTGAAGGTHWGVIRASGADAASFLHNQLTNAITGLAEGVVRLAGYCSPKGRLLASFVVWRQADDILLACHHSVLQATLKRLSMFVLRARCRLTDATAELPIWGIAGTAVPAGAADRRFLPLPDAAGNRRGLWIAAEPPAGPALALDDWRWLEVQSGVATIEATTADRFVPQMVNYELIGGVDFGKGCYPGQEVVARSQYRGTVKRRTHLFDIGGAMATAPLAGTDVFHAFDPAQPAGAVANAAIDSRRGVVSALVEVKSALLDGGALRVGASDGPLLVRRELPYALPADGGETA